MADADHQPQHCRRRVSGSSRSSARILNQRPSPFTDAADHITFPPNSSLPIHLVHWRIPINGSYTISPPGYADTLRLSPSRLNLTGYDGNYAGPEGQTFVGRRQTDTLFTYSVNMQFTPQSEGDEAGISVFLTQVWGHEHGVTISGTEASRIITSTSGWFSWRTRRLHHHHSQWRRTSASPQRPIFLCRHHLWFRSMGRIPTILRCRTRR